VLDPKVIWNDADINGRELADAVVHVWGLLNAARIRLGRDRMSLPTVNKDAVVRATRILEGKA
jgi:hypothetical protein